MVPEAIFALPAPPPASAGDCTLSHAQECPLGGPSVPGRWGAPTTTHTVSSTYPATTSGLGSDQVRHTRLLVPLASSTSPSPLPGGPGGQQLLLHSLGPWNSSKFLNSTSKCKSQGSEDHLTIRSGVADTPRVPRQPTSLSGHALLHIWVIFII